MKSFLFLTLLIFSAMTLQAGIMTQFSDAQKTWYQNNMIRWEQMGDSVSLIDLNKERIMLTNPSRGSYAESSLREYLHFMKNFFKQMEAQMQKSMAAHPQAETMMQQQEADYRAMKKSAELLSAGTDTVCRLLAKRYQVVYKDKVIGELWLSKGLYDKIYTHIRKHKARRFFDAFEAMMPDVGPANSRIVTQYERELAKKHIVVKSVAYLESKRDFEQKSAQMPANSPYAKQMLNAFAQTDELLLWQEGQFPSKLFKFSEISKGLKKVDLKTFMEDSMHAEADDMPAAMPDFSPMQQDTPPTDSPAPSQQPNSDLMNDMQETFKGLFQ